VYTPAVFVRVANKGVAGYGTWKKIRKMGAEEERGRKVGAETLRAQRERYRSGMADVSSINHDQR
jgi:hypothetical protein